MLFTLASILSTPEKRKVLEDLKGEHAQSVINFFQKVRHGVAWCLLHTYLPLSTRQLLSQPPNSSLTWLRKNTLLALRKLCGSSVLSPSLHVLKDIDYVSRDGGGSFSDIYLGKQGSLALCLKVMRLGSRDKVEKTLKVVLIYIRSVPHVLICCAIKSSTRKRQSYGGNFVILT